MAIPQQRIFLSHSSKDHDFCVRLVDDLRRILGDDDAVWYDAHGGLHGGDAWWHKIEQELNTRTTFIVVLSPDAVDSAWVNDEIDIAWRRKNHPDPASRMRLIPLLLRPCAIRPSLESLQVVSFLPPKAYETALQDLLTALTLPSQPAGNRGDQQSTAPLLRTLFARPEAMEILHTLNDHTDSVYSVALSADGSMLASSSRDNTIKLWNTQTGQLLRTLNDTYSATSVALSADGLFLVSKSGYTIKLWNALTGQPLNTFNFTYSVEYMALSANGLILALDQSKTIQIWNVQTGKLLNTLKGYRDFITCVALSAEGRILASGSYDKTIKLWNVQTGRLLNTLKGHRDSINSVALSADGLTLVSSTFDTIKFWDVQTGKLLRDHETYAKSLALSADGLLLASCEDHGVIKIWNVQTGWLLCTLEGHRKTVNSVAWSANGLILASGSDDETINIWGIKE